MHRRSLLMVSAVLVSACMVPSDPEAENPVLPPGATGQGLRAIESPPAVSTARLGPASPRAAIEDALVRLLPAFADQSVAMELRPLLQEAQRAMRRGLQDEDRAFDKVRARLDEIDADWVDPDLAAVRLALESSRRASWREEPTIQPAPGAAAHSRLAPRSMVSP